MDGRHEQVMWAIEVCVQVVLQHEARSWPLATFWLSVSYLSKDSIGVTCLDRGWWQSRQITSPTAMPVNMQMVMLSVA